MPNTAFAQNRLRRLLKDAGEYPKAPPASNTRERGKAPRCGTSLAQFVTAKLNARRAAGETLDKIGILQDHVKAFA